jgi:hypothetical protein
VTDRPAHDVDCELRRDQPEYCACSYRASLVKLERQAEEDRAAIRYLKRKVNALCGCRDCQAEAKKHAAAIARAERP